MMGQSETLSTSLGQIYYTLFDAGAQRLSPSTARCTNMLSQNQFPEPNRHVVDFLHQFFCRRCSLALSQYQDQPGM
jgi:hypothetical protein